MKIEKSLIEKYNIPAPRYTSYPPANHFKEGISEEKYIQLIKESNKKEPQHIAFYIHIPFCSKICYYCGCNAFTSRNNKQITDYIEALKTEIKNTITLIDKNRKISQIHFGGGTPNAIEAKYIKEIVILLSESFLFIDKPEIAIECNPAHLDKLYIDQLLAAGFNRFSFGIQDFDSEILKNVNREPSLLPINEILGYLREKSPEASINLDFIYGLPGQSVNSFVKTIQQAAELKPDRLVTFSYAHVPWLKKHQQILDKKGLPCSDEKMDMFLASRKLLINEGYSTIGLDHYVLPSDELNTALKNKELHRNFQGYCTKRTTGQVYAFGVSAISQLENAYLQNVKDIKTYNGLIEQGKTVIEKTYILSKKELIIKDAITELMCNGILNFKEIAEKHNISLDSFKSISGIKDDAFDELIADELMEFENDAIKVSDLGMLFIRNIAIVLDPAYKAQQNKYSKTV